ncbi:MAG: hypothetical protein Unbinned6747contig1000_42 [Prokaryotic dsDNA virus sp.]|nr:MAG: hypothetical protein Unbinned6747contig1000_42 [Prokaryotic dsDNA virus sp.]|tara:strand:+ start:5707 stop:5982 length:276 start_codon:yes stop_codon:yes gene_type:complete
MIVDTKYGQYECKNISRKERRILYKKVKEISASNDVAKLHDLADEFAVIAFGDEKKAEEKLGKLSAVQEDEVLNQIIGSYMGFELGKDIGD